MIVCDTPDKIAMFRMYTLRGALYLETLGMSRHHAYGSVYTRIKKEFGFKGTKLAVLMQLEDHIEHVTGTRLAKRYTT